MHSSLNRLQTSFGFFTTCAFSLAAFISFLSLIPFPQPSTQPSATITPREIQVLKGRPHYYSSKREEHASVRFDLDADLSPLFNWNTKQLFVYVTVNYPSTKLDSKNKASAGTNTNEVSESVIWDLIIPAPATPWSWTNIKNTYFPDAKTLRAQRLKAKQNKGKKTTTTTDLTKPGRINLKNQKPKYQITDPSGVLAGRSNVTLQVNWNVQPWVGALVWNQGYLGSRVGEWKSGRVGRSKAFDLPVLKGSKPAEQVSREAAGEKTPEAGEGKPLTEI